MSNKKFSYVRNIGDFPIYKCNGKYYYNTNKFYQIRDTDFIQLSTDDLESFVKGEMPDDFRRRLDLFRRLAV